MIYTLTYNNKTYQVESFDVVEEYVERDAKRSRLLYFKIPTEGVRKIIVVKLYYPPYDYRENYSLQTILAIDEAINKHISFYTLMSYNKTLNLDEEFNNMPIQLREYFEIYEKEMDGQTHQNYG